MSAPFGQAELDALLKHINTKWKDPSCRMCGANEWQIQTYAMLGLVPRVDTPMPALNANRAVPLVVLMCGNCGNTMLVNAITAGAAVQPTEPVK